MILAVIEDEVFLIAIFLLFFIIFLVVLRFFDMFHKKLKIESI